MTGRIFSRILRIADSWAAGGRGWLRKILIGLVCLGFVGAGFGQQTFVGAHGRLSVKGNRIVDEHGKPVTLRGMSLYCWAEGGTQFYNARAINRLAQDWKCTVIRIPVLPQEYKKNPTNEISKVRTVMESCLANGIYAIVDWHSMAGAQKDIPLARAFFSTVAAAYGKTPNILYEPWNEPEHETWPVVKAYHEAIIPAIRAMDPDNIIICGNPVYDKRCADASANPIACTSNIVYSIHFYAATHKQLLRDDGSQALANGVALFASEYGTTLASGNGPCDTAETLLWWSWLEANNVGSANWSASCMAETSAAFKPGTPPSGPWTDAMLKPSGLMVRDYIKSHYSPPQ
jgi:endoglucanase